MVKLPRIPGESTLGGLKSLSVIFLLLLNFNNFSLSELQSSAINVCSFQTTCHPGTLKLDDDAGDDPVDEAEKFSDVIDPASSSLSRCDWS